jgi:hypothetical protein
MSRSETFHLRWRGRVTGPHSWPDIERKLDAHEIGLLHDLQHNHEWTTLGDYLALRNEVKRVAPNAAAAPPASAADFQVGSGAPKTWLQVIGEFILGKFDNARRRAPQPPSKP